MNPLYKSQFNIEELLMYPLYYILLIVYPTWAIIECNIIIKYLVVGTIPIFCYVIWCTFINIYYFYEDKIKIIYIFRFVRREKIVLYSYIKEIRYIHTAGAKQPIVALIYQGKTFSSILWPSNSFTLRYFKKRKEILLFLNNKGIPIIVNSVFKRDKEIFK
jgi:hypothetical protein